MPIVVYWLDAPGVAAHRELGDHELGAALKLAEQLRRDGKRHVSLSSELADSVGRPGVDAVQDGRLPDGGAYTFDKRHRGAGPAPSTDKSS
jgi:hypothetical protein